jgi:hypothetical protein
MPERSHPFPSRTRKLSSPGPMVLQGQLCGRVGRCRGFEGLRFARVSALHLFSAHRMSAPSPAWLAVAARGPWRRQPSCRQAPLAASELVLIGPWPGCCPHLPHRTEPSRMRAASATLARGAHAAIGQRRSADPTSGIYRSAETRQAGLAGIDRSAGINRSAETRQAGLAGIDRSAETRP